MAFVCSIDFNTSPMNSNVHDTEFMDRSIAKSTFLDQDSIHFQKGRITPDLPMFAASTPFCLDDFEPVPIGVVKTPYHQAALESMLKETVELLFGSSSASSSKRKLLEEDESMNKKRRRSSSDFSDDGSSRSSGSDDLRFRPYQSQQWGERFEELKEFKRINGHCSVPYDHPVNPSLARWVKRQRYQYKLHMEGQPSAMTEERLQALEAVGFVWDTYTAAWCRRISELKVFQQEYGHTNVPATYRKNKKLAAFVKCQRRQYKLFIEGKANTLSHDRINDLNEMSFQWTIRGNKDIYHVKLC